MWDFNLSFGNADYCNANTTSGWQYEFDNICNFSTSIPFWWGKLLEDPNYANALRCRWEELRDGPLHTDSINYFIDSVASYVQEGRIRNFQRWPIIGVYVNWNGFVGQTYQEDLDYLKTYMEQRSVWLDNNIPGTCYLAIDEPEFVPEYHKAWPNPFENELNIGYSLFEPGDITIQIIDLFGRVVHHLEYENQYQGAHAVNITQLDLEQGGYFYTINQNGALLYQGKLIKK